MHKPDIGPVPPHRALPDPDVNAAAWNYTEAALLKTPPSKSRLFPLLLSHLILYWSLHGLSVAVKLFSISCSTHFPPGTIAYSFLAIKHAFLLSFPPTMSFLKSFPECIFFFTKEFFPNSFPHWSFTYFVLFPRAHVSHLGYEWLLHGAGTQS